MTRFSHDQFAKDYLEELLSRFGEVKAPRRVADEMREVDVCPAHQTPSGCVCWAEIGYKTRPCQS